MDLDWEYPTAGRQISLFTYLFPRHLPVNWSLIHVDEKTFGCFRTSVSLIFVADDRGGKAEDKANFVLLSKEIKEAFGKRYGYSITLPASYWYLQHFDLKNLQPHVDWFNLMSYDLHGTWDAASKFVGPYVATHTNMTEIDLGLDLLWRAGVKPKNVVLGQGCAFPLLVLMFI